MEHTIEIKKIISGGTGLGHLDDGMVVMTPFVLPGELVRVTESKRFSGYLQAQTLKIERSSPERCMPFCPQFKVCGGCNLQHTPYKNQLTIKNDILAETLSRAHLIPEEDLTEPIQSPQPQGYRYRIRLHIARDGAMGFHKTGSNDVVQIDQCPLATPPLNNVLLQLIQTNLLPELARTCKQIELSCSPADTVVTAILSQRSKSQPAQELINILLADTQLQSIALRVKQKTKFLSKPVILQQHFSTNEFKYSLGWDSRCFFQINPKQNEQLVALICSQAGTVTGRSILDLFCGMGNFSIPLGLAGAAVTGIERNKYSIQAAKENARNAGVQKSCFFSADVSHYLQEQAQKKSQFDLILLDPPRQGLGKATRFLPALGAEKILYISCDPATLSRDLNVLTKSGYRLGSVTPVDMFPQTHHIECLAVLEKN